MFGRPEAFGAVQRCPDIDVLVPRAALDAVREYVRAARSGPFPVAIDASGAACFIDLRPGSEQSYLTHRRLRFPVPSDLFAPTCAAATSTGTVVSGPCLAASWTPSCLAAISTACSCRTSWSTFPSQDAVGAALARLGESLAAGGRIAVTFALTHVAVAEHLYAAGFDVTDHWSRWLWLPTAA